MSDDRAEINQAKFVHLHAFSRGQFDAETKVLGVTKIYLRLILNKLVGKLPIFWHLAGNVVNHDFLSEF